MKMNRHHPVILMAATLALIVVPVCAEQVVSPAASAKDAPSIEPRGTATESSSTAPARSRVRPQRRAGIDERMALLTKELSLDAAQQAEVRKILEMQRAHIVQVWNDESAPAAQRVYRTRAISERTEDGIRALLTDEQKQKYFKPRPAGVAAGGAPADLATWMDKVNGR
jgi:hypothetical protein